MKQMEIGENEAGQRMDKYLKKLLPYAESSFIYKMLRKKNIVLKEWKKGGRFRSSCCRRYRDSLFVGRNV